MTRAISVWRKAACGLGLFLALVSGQAQPLTVSAAASLTEAMREIGPRFEVAQPGAQLRFNFAASGVLLQQLRQGAPVDVLVSADAETLDRGITLNVLDGDTRRVVAANALVMVRPALAVARPLLGLNDLTNPAVQRIAIGKPATVPAGRYAQQALNQAGLWPAVQSRLIPADSARQVLDYVARGEVDAGFVYRTDAALMPDKVQVVATLSGHAPILYPAAVVSDSRQKAQAAAFIAFLLGAEAQAVFAKHGFARPAR